VLLGLPQPAVATGLILPARPFRCNPVENCDPVENGTNYYSFQSLELVVRAGDIFFAVPTSIPSDACSPCVGKWETHLNRNRAKSVAKLNQQGPDPGSLGWLFF